VLGNRLFLDTRNKPFVGHLPRGVLSIQNESQLNVIGQTNP